MELIIDTEDEGQMRRLTSVLLGELKSRHIIGLLSTADRMTPYAESLKAALQRMGADNDDIVVRSRLLRPLSFKNATRRYGDRFRRSITRAFRARTFPRPVR
jgi:hypothetical protein